MIGLSCIQIYFNLGYRDIYIIPRGYCNAEKTIIIPIIFTNHIVHFTLTRPWSSLFIKVLKIENSCRIFKMLFEIRAQEHLLSALDFCICVCLARISNRMLQILQLYIYNL